MSGKKCKCGRFLNQDKRVDTDGRCPSCFVAYYEGYRDAMLRRDELNDSLFMAIRKRVVVNGKSLSLAEKAKRWLEQAKGEL